MECPHFCGECAPEGDRFVAQVKERDEALVKSERVRAQLRTAAETLQKRLAQAEKRLAECQETSLSSSACPSHDTSTTSGSDGSTTSRSDHQVRALVAEIAMQKVRSDADARELAVLQSEVTQRRRQSEVDLREFESLQVEVSEREADNERLRSALEQSKLKLSQVEALAQERSRELASVKATWVVPSVMHDLENELAELRAEIKAKEDAKVTNPLDALDAMQRDLEGAASMRKAAIGDTHKKAQLTLQVAELKDTLNRVTQENAQYKTLISKLEDEAIGLRSACQQSADSVVQRYDDLRTELKVLRDERRETYAHMGKLEEENKRLRRIHDEGRVQRMESELKNLSVEIDRLRSCNSALCSQLFGDEANKTGGDFGANMLLQGQRPMDEVIEEENAEDVEKMHIKTIARLQKKLTDCEEAHFAEKEQLMEKVKQLERNNAARLALPSNVNSPAPTQTQHAVAPTRTLGLSRLPSVNSISNYMPSTRSIPLNVKASFSSLIN